MNSTNASGKVKSSPKTSSNLGEETLFGKAYDYRVLKRFSPYLLQQKLLIFSAIIAMLIFTGTQLALPWIIKTGIDDYITKGNYHGLNWIVGIFIANSFISWSSLYAQEVIISKAGLTILYHLRGNLFSHLQKLSLSFHSKTQVGRIMSRVQGDVFQLQEFIGVAVVTLADLLTLGGIVAILMIMNLKLGLIAMSVLPLLAIIMMIWQPFAIRSFIAVRSSISKVNSGLNENITGVRVVQGMNREERNMENFKSINKESLDSTNSAGKLAFLPVPPVEMLTSISIALVLFFGAGMASNGSLELGALIAYVMYIQRFFEPIRSLTLHYSQLQRTMASGMRIFELLDVQPELLDIRGARQLPRLKGEVEFKNANFSYVPGIEILKDINLHINPGETVAIVGPTGAGKTTLVSLISRFYELSRSRGSLTIDGNDIRDYTRASLVSQISTVLQEPFLFSGTVKDNIRYKHTEVEDRLIVEAAKGVGAHDFIMDLENGYDTILQERSVNLSMGQRQLLCFARAIIGNPRILILDEATANVDSYTETFIQKALNTLFKDRTSIVIAHRLSTIRGADQIVVLDQGTISEKGTHDQLIDQNGLYAHLYRMNFAELETVPNLKTT